MTKREKSVISDMIRAYIAYATDPDFAVSASEKEMLSNRADALITFLSDSGNDYRDLLDEYNAVFEEA